MAIRSDKAKNFQKVAKAVMLDPLATQRDIADSAKVSLGTANNMISELEQT